MDFGTVVAGLKKNLSHGVGAPGLTATVLQNLEDFYSTCLWAPYAVQGGLEAPGAWACVKADSLAVLDDLIAQAQRFRALVEAVPVRTAIADLPPLPEPRDPIGDLCEKLDQLIVALASRAL